MSLYCHRFLFCWHNSPFSSSLKLARIRKADTDKLMKEKMESDRKIRREVQEFETKQKKEAEKLEIQREMEATKVRDEVCNEVNIPCGTDSIVYFSIF